MKVRLIKMLEDINEREWCDWCTIDCDDPCADDCEECPFFNAETMAELIAELKGDEVQK